MLDSSTLFTGPVPPTPFVSGVVAGPRSGGDRGRWRRPVLRGRGAGGDSRVGVAELLGDHVGGDAFGDQLDGVGVPHAVGVDPLVKPGPDGSPLRSTTAPSTAEGRFGPRREMTESSHGQTTVKRSRARLSILITGL